MVSIYFTISFTDLIMEKKQNIFNSYFYILQIGREICVCMFGLDGILTTTFFSSERLTGQGLSSVLAIKMRRQLFHKSLIKICFKTTNCVICLHKIRVDGGGVFRELVQDISD